ncbi:MAG: DUF1800 family protein [bacterium]|nr:DUF1800 family protein [bacterium]
MKKFELVGGPSSAARILVLSLVSLGLMACGLPSEESSETAPVVSATSSDDGGSATAVRLVALSINDADSDGFDDADDNCPSTPNDQQDADSDGIGDACECGDSNGDGIVDTTDARLIQLCSVDLVPCADLCDVNGDESCDTTDARIVQLMVAGVIQKSDLTCGQRPGISCTVDLGCDTGSLGMCASGTMTCPDGPFGPSVCEASHQPQGEICDGRDRDCDGQIDRAGCPCFDGISPEGELHILQRIAYGPDEWTQARMAELGPCGFIEEQLHPETIEDGDFQAIMAERFDSLEMSFLELRQNYPQPMRVFIQGVGWRQVGKGLPMVELAQAKVLRAAVSHRQLEAVLTDFWFNHFNVFGPFNQRRWDTIPYERDTIRPNILGRFGDFVLATAQAPAMLDYLDNKLNVREGFVGTGTGRSINENYGRELMELHTVGVDGGYDQQDIIELARVLTGWQIDPNLPGGFWYRSEAHDDEAKEVMGLQIAPGGGLQDGLDAIEYLTKQGATAVFISRKLIRRFVSEEPQEGLVIRAAIQYLINDGDLREVMRTILYSPEFLADSNTRQVKVKRPHVLMASLMRSLQADAEPLLTKMPTTLLEMGEQLYGVHPPTGYPDESAFWAGPGGLMSGQKHFERAVHGLDGWNPEFDVSATAFEDIVDELIGKYFPLGVSVETRAGAIALLEAMGPQAQIKRVQQAAAFLFSSPEFLLH